MSFNKVIIEGRTGADPVIKVFDNGSKVATFSVATTERGYKTKDGKEIPPKTDWHNVVVRGGLATVVERYVKKGSQLLICGKLRNREYEKEGKKVRLTEIVAEDLNLLGAKPQGAAAEPSDTQQSTDAHWADAPEEGDDLPF